MDMFIFAVGFIGLVVALVMLVIDVVKKKPKKKPAIGLVVCIVLMIVGLAMAPADTGGEDETPVADAGAEENKPEEQEELDKKLKTEAAQADFIKVNGDEVEEDTKLTAQGEVTVKGDSDILKTFTLTTKEDDGYGMYSITNLSTEEISEGDYVQVWGIYSGKDEAGMPSITATIIEKTEAPEPEITKYKAGSYKIGEDMPAGEYKIFTDSMGYIELTKDSSGDLDSIIMNDNFSTFTYLTVEDGQYLKLQGAEAVPGGEAPAYEPDGMYEAGMYKVGKDIPAGEYNVKQEEGAAMAYIEISTSSTGLVDDIITNDNFEGNKHITVEEGQYLKIQGGYIEK